MSISNILTENDERLIAREIVKLLRQKGVSYNQAERILNMACNQMGNIPISGIGKEPEMLFTPTDSSRTKYSAESNSIARPTTSHE